VTAPSSDVPSSGFTPPFPPEPYPYPYAARSPAVSPAGQPLAGFGERLGAYVIDSLIYGAVAMLLLVPIIMFFLFVWWVPVVEAQEYGETLTGPEFLRFVGGLLLMQAAMILVLLGVAYVYHVELMFRTGQTLGKRILRLRVVPLDPAGRLDRGAAARRYLVEFVGGTFVPAFSYVDGLWQLWDKPHQQCLHDKFARTVVVKVATA
jgi:uncharacterized RDD family membrane protein YckC